jgi:hypothetical protein
MDQLKKAYRTTVKIGLWLMGSLLLCAVFVESVTSGRVPFVPPAPLPFLGRLKTALLILSGAALFLVPLVRDRVLSGRSNPPFNARQARYSPDVRRLMTSSISGFGLAESIAVFGLTFFLLGGGSGDFYLFLLLSLFCFSLYFPNYRRWERWIKGRSGTGSGKK